MHWATFMSRHGTFKYLGVQFVLVTFRPLSVKRSSEPRRRPMSSSNVHRAGYRPLISVSPRLFMTPVMPRDQSPSPVGASQRRLSFCSRHARQSPLSARTRVTKRSAFAAAFDPKRTHQPPNVERGSGFGFLPGPANDYSLSDMKESSK